MVEHPEVFNHVGLLFNRPVAAATCPSSSHPTTLSYVALSVRLDPDRIHIVYHAEQGKQADCVLVWDCYNTPPVARKPGLSSFRLHVQARYP